MNRVNTWMDATVQDLRFAVRSWTRAPAFAIAAVATLALGIGANTAIVSIANGVLVRPLPFSQPENLVQLYETQPRTPSALGFDGPVVYQDFEQWRAHSRLLDRLLTYVHARKNVQSTIGGEIVPVITVGAERGLFAMLGVSASLGRTFDDHDPLNVAVASHAFWAEQLHGDPSAVGRGVTIDGQSYTLIGVMPESFQFPYRTSTTGLFDGFVSTGLWIPWEVPADLREHPERRMESVVARLKPGATLEAVRRELAAMDGPSRGQRLVRISPLRDVVSGPARESLLVLLGAVAMVLLVACVNVMNLLIARTTSRGGEIALRAALGASRGRLMRQLLTESALMALVAGSIGLVIGIWSSRLLIALAGAQIPRAHEIGLDWRVLALLLTVCLATGLACGLAPALIASRGDVHTIKRGGVADTLRNGLVVSEIALVFVLLAGAGLLLRTFVNLQQTDPGLNAANVLTAHIVAADGTQALAIEQRVARMPGVRAAGLISLLPMQNTGWSAGFTVPGSGETSVHQAELRFVTPGYFQAMGIPLRRGRFFSPNDRQGGPRVILVNDALVRDAFPGQDPLGRDTDRGTIVGVVGDVRQDSLRQPARPEIYITVAQSFAQLPTHGSTLVVRGERESAPLAGAIRAAVREINPNQALFRVESMRGVVEASMADSRLYAWLVGVFAALGLVLAMTGIYGVIAYLVALRTREFGIRMALGADPGGVLRLVLRHGLGLTAIGLVLGVALAGLVTRVLRGVLYGVAPTDAVTFAIMAVVLALAALAAYAIPARRASRVDPAIALREGVAGSRSAPWRG